MPEMPGIPEYLDPKFINENSCLRESQIFQKIYDSQKFTTIFILIYWLRYSEMPGMSNIPKVI